MVRSLAPRGFIGLMALLIGVAIMALLMVLMLEKVIKNDSDTSNTMQQGTEINRPNVYNAGERKNVIDSAEEAKKLLERSPI